MFFRAFSPSIRFFSSAVKYFDQIYLSHLDGSRYKLGLKYTKDKWENVVYINLPKVGSKVNKGENIVSVECDKTVFDIESPLDVEIIAHNNEVLKDNSLLENDPEGKGWLMEVLHEP